MVERETPPAASVRNSYCVGVDLLKNTRPFRRNIPLSAIRLVLSRGAPADPRSDEDDFSVDDQCVNTASYWGQNGHHGGEALKSLQILPKRPGQTFEYHVGHSGGK